MSVEVQNIKAYVRQRIPREIRLLKAWFFGYRPVSLIWLFDLCLKNSFGRQVRIGFGPIVESEPGVGVRGFRIDPIVKCINKFNNKYQADIFFSYEEIARFDIAVIVRGGWYKFGDDSPFALQGLCKAKKKGTLIVYDIVDSLWFFNQTSNSQSKRHSELFDTFMGLVDGLILSSPVQADDIRDYSKVTKLIEHPVINYEHKKNYETSSNKLTIIWQGHFHVFSPMTKLYRIIDIIRKETGLDVIFVCSSDCEPRDEGAVKYVKWQAKTWGKLLAEADIAVTIKPLDDPHQQRKPSTRVLCYMAAGLPVVCTPTESDKLVIKHGETGFFAYTDEEWYRYLKELVVDAKLRQRIGVAGRKYAIENFNVDKIAKKYADLFDQLIGKSI